jgi:hypothetical protein
MSELAERPRAAQRRWSPLNVVRFAIAGLLMGSAFAHGSDWQPFVSALLIGLVAADLIWRAIRARNMIFAALGIYSLFAALGVFLAHAVRPGRSVLWVVVALTAASAAFALISAAVAGMRERELDKLIFSNASSIAFFAVMLVAVTYGLIDNWLRVPALSPWVIVFTGGGTWIVGYITLRRRYS